MPFTPGLLTASQAAALNEMERELRAFRNMTVTGGTIQRAAGCVNLRIPTSEDEFWVTIYAVADFGDAYYSWRRVEYTGESQTGIGGFPTYQLPSLVDSTTTPAIGTYEGNNGYLNLIVAHRLDDTANGGGSQFYPRAMSLRVGDVVKVRRATGSRPGFGGEPEGRYPLFVTDGETIQKWQLTRLLVWDGTNPVPTGAAVTSVYLSADNLRIEAGGTGLGITPINPPPGPGR